MENQIKGNPIPRLRQASFRISVIYGIIGGAWILFSDQILEVLITDPELLTWTQTVKGWLFIGVTALLLYWLIKRDMAEIEHNAKVRWESEARYQTLFQTAPVSIWEIDLSGVLKRLDSLRTHPIKDYGRYFATQPALLQQLLAEVKVLSINAATLQIFAAQNPAELLNSLDRVFPTEAIQTFRDGIIKIASGDRYFETEVPVVSLLGEQKTVLLRLAIPSDSTQFGNVPFCVVDITERRRTEEMLRLLESAVRQAREAITITTARLEPPGPEIVFVNPAFTAMTGYSANEVIGQTPRVLQGPNTDQTTLDRMRQCLWQRQTFQCETINYRKDGTEFINEWTVAPILDKSFKVTHFVAVQRDITERKRAEQEIKQLNEDLLRRAEELEKTNAKLREISNRE